MLNMVLVGIFSKGRGLPIRSCNGAIPAMERRVINFPFSEVLVTNMHLPSHNSYCCTCFNRMSKMLIFSVTSWRHKGFLQEWNEKQPSNEKGWWDIEWDRFIYAVGRRHDYAGRSIRLYEDVISQNTNIKIVGLQCVSKSDLLCIPER